MSSTRLSACASRARMYWLRKSLFPSADSHLKTVALSGISTSAQIARRLSPSAMRLQIASPSSVVNNDGRPIGRFRGVMVLDQFDRRAHLATYYARRLCGARVRPRSVRPRSRSNRGCNHELRLGSIQCKRETASGDRKRVVRGGGALSGIIVRTRGSNRRRKWASTLSDMPVPALPALKELAVIGVIAEQERAEVRPRTSLMGGKPPFE